MKFIRKCRVFSLEGKEVTFELNNELISKFVMNELLPSFNKLCEYVNQFGEEGGFDTMLEFAATTAAQNAQLAT